MDLLLLMRVELDKEHYQGLIGRSGAVSAAMPCWAAKATLHRRRCLPCAAPSGELGESAGLRDSRGCQRKSLLAWYGVRVESKQLNLGKGTLMLTCARSLWLLLVAGSFWLASAASAVTIDWVTVGDPGNACDTQSQGCFGAVGYAYRIAKLRGHERPVRRVPEREGGLRPARALQHEHGLGLRRHHAQRQLGQLHLQRDRRPRGHAGELRVVLRRAALRELAAQRPGRAATRRRGPTRCSAGRPPRATARR